MGIHDERGWRSRLAEQCGFKLRDISQWVSRNKLPEHFKDKVKGMGYSLSEWYSDPDENISEPPSVNDASSIYSSNGLTLEEQVEILKENRSLKTQLQSLSDYINQHDRKGRNERRKCVGDLKKIINFKEYKDDPLHKHITSA